jgi:4-alpha-glucanotransferase
MHLSRHSGILLHLTSLPGPHGSGDLGPSAYHFVDWLVAGRQSLWQVLPLGGIGPGNSPYMSPSASAGNELLIDLAQLVDHGWLDADALVPDPGFRDERVDFPRAIAFRMSRLKQAARRFHAEGRAADRQRFEVFCHAEQGWLDDYALFMALDARQRESDAPDATWQDWPAALARREPAALAAAAAELAEECASWKFWQWCFREQWQRLKAYANGRGVRIVGDMPIFVSPHSADVWAHPQLFDLEADGRLRVVAGVPPDYFSEKGQHWGNPLYDWAAHAREGYRWWIERMRNALTLFDLVRIDHFRGFEAYWAIPAAADSAVEGAWQPGPGRALFSALYAALGLQATPQSAGRLIIAEDLGIITPAVDALRAAAGLPGMRVLQFAFNGDAGNAYLPHNFTPYTVVYTGTHDNDTTLGWWQALPAATQDQVRRYLAVSGDAIHWDFIRAASASVARFAVVPMQDVLGLDSTARMNLPGSVEGVWCWRFHWGQVDGWHADRLAELAALYGRLPQAEVATPESARGADILAPSH